MEIGFEPNESREVYFLRGAFLSFSVNRKFGFLGQPGSKKLLNSLQVCADCNALGKGKSEREPDTQLADTARWGSAMNQVWHLLHWCTVLWVEALSIHCENDLDLFLKNRLRNGKALVPRSFRPSKLKTESPRFA